jgi:hypothetical protein
MNWLVAYDLSRRGRQIEISVPLSTSDRAPRQGLNNSVQSADLHCKTGARVDFLRKFTLAPVFFADFDVDAFIVSNKLAARIRTRGFRDGGRIPEVRQIQKQIDVELRQSPDMGGLRTKDKFTFRVFTQAEIQRRMERDNDSQIFFVAPDGR